MNDYDKRIYENACKKWGKEIVDDEWVYWDPIEIEQGYIIMTQTVLDIVDKKDSSVLEDEILHSSILTIDYIDELNTVEKYYDLNESSNFSYMGFYMTRRDKLAFDKGIMVDIELLHLLARFDDDNEDNDINRYWYVVKCTENNKLKKMLKEYFRNKYQGTFYISLNKKNKIFKRYLIIDDFGKVKKECNSEELINFVDILLTECKSSKKYDKEIIESMLSEIKYIQNRLLFTTKIYVHDSIPSIYLENIRSILNFFNLKLAF